MKALAMEARRVVSACVFPVVRRAARAYVAGDQLDDALRICGRLHMRGLRSTIGYWNADDEDPRQIAGEYLIGLEALAWKNRGDYLSIKLPSLGFSRDLLYTVAERARLRGVRLHFDALGLEGVDRTQGMIDELLRSVPGIQIGYTIPGRWKRSLRDVDWAVERKLRVRVVKGQWIDPEGPAELRAGFLAVTAALAGRAEQVAVASHDATVIADSVRQLQLAATPVELELLHGLPSREPLALAQRFGLPVRFYVPYGRSYLPYALSKVQSSPRTAWWLVKDLLAVQFAPA